jgi:KDO2-lipid IV(A) lauroyltransferase
MTTLPDIFIRTIGCLPLPMIRTLGSFLGLVLAKLPTRLKQTTEHHLAHCLPEISAEDRAQIAKDSLVASAHAIVEAPAIWFGPIARRRRWIAASADQLNTIRQAQAAGKGVILLTPHQGAWELASFYCAQVAPLTVLYKPQKGLADRLILEGRARGAPITPVPTTSRGVKALLSALKAGEMVGILPDHDPPEASGTVFAPLFGIPANTMDLVTKLAARTGAPVLYVVVERLPWTRGYRFHVLKAPPAIADPVQGPTALNAGIERCVRMLPGQYWWSYRRFRRRPPGAPAFYN